MVFPERVTGCAGGDRRDEMCACHKIRTYIVSICREPLQHAFGDGFLLQTDLDSAGIHEAFRLNEHI